MGLETTQQHISLIEPILEFEAEFSRWVEEFQRTGEDHHLHKFAGHDFAEHLHQLSEMAQGINLSPGIVPMTTYWLVNDRQTIVGESRLRHCLTPELEFEGGHIGYFIRPSERRKGYGTLILKLTLERARMLGLERVLVTCDTDNTPSVRIIENNGGRLSGHAVSHRSGKQISQYWIEFD